MPQFYFDKQQRQVVAADTDEAIQEAEDSGLIPLADENDTPFDLPVEFRNKETGERLTAQSRAAYDEAKGTPGLVEFKPTTEERFAEQRRERAAIQQQSMQEQALSYGESVADVTNALLQSFGRSMLPGVYSATQRALGIPAEQQEALAQAYPGATGAGTVLGLAGTLAVTGGLGGAAKLAGAEAAAAAAAAGGERLAQGLAAARAASTTGLRASELAAAPVSAAMRASEAVRAGLTAAAPLAAEIALGRAAIGAASAGVAALPLAAAYEYDESKLKDRAMSSEAILHNALLAGAIGTLEGAIPLLKGIGESETGKRWASSLGKSQATRLVTKFASPNWFKKASEQIGEAGVVRRINEAVDQGLLGLGKSAGKSVSDIQTALVENGNVIGQIADEATLRGVAPKSVEPMLERISDEVIAPLMGKGATVAPSEAQSVNILSEVADRIKNSYPDGMTPKDLARMRTDLSNEIFGTKEMMDPERNFRMIGLRKIRDIMTDELGDIMEASSVGKTIWKRAQDQYGVLKTAEDLAERGLFKTAFEQGLDDRTLAIAADLARYKGLGPILTGAGAVLGKRGTTLAYDWAQGALRQALESKAPASTVKALQELSEARAVEASNALAGIAAKPETVAKSEFWRLSSMLDGVGRTSGLSAGAASAVRSAQNALRSFQSGRMISGMSAISRIQKGATASELAVELESARDALAAASRARKGFTPNETDVATLRALRSEIDASLADAGLWGPERMQRAQDFYRDIIATRTDPARVAALEGLDEATMGLRRKTTSKVDKLFGMTTKAAIVVPSETDLERERFKERLFGRKEQP